MLAVTMKPCKFRPVGQMGIYHVLSKEGTVRLEACAALPAAAAAPGTAPGAPNFDYTNKLFVNITALDIVNIVQSPLTVPVRGARAGRRFAPTPRSAPPPPPPPPLSPPPSTPYPTYPLSQISVSYSDAVARGGRLVNRRLDIAPAPATPAAARAGGVAAAAPSKAPSTAPGLVTLSITNDSLCVSVSLAQQEMYLLRNLLGLSIPHLTGWQYQMVPGSFDPEVNLATGAGAKGGDGDGDGMDMDAPAAATAAPAPSAPSAPQQQYPPRGGGYAPRR